MYRNSELYAILEFIGDEDWREYDDCSGRLRSLCDWGHGLSRFAMTVASRLAPMRPGRSTLLPALHRQLRFSGRTTVTFFFAALPSSANTPGGLSGFNNNQVWSDRDDAASKWVLAASADGLEPQGHFSGDGCRDQRDALGGVTDAAAPKPGKRGPYTKQQE
jgi:hypothetical protein